MDKNKKPLKSALKKTSSAPAAHASTNTNTSIKRKHASSVTTSTKPNAGNANKRAKPDNKNHNSKSVTAGSKINGNNKKGVTSVTGAKKGVAFSTPAVKKTVVHKPKKDVEVPEGATLEDFRIVAGTYENILYGVDAYWNEDMTLRLSPIFIFAAHIGCIKSLAIGGNYLASGSTDEKIQLYDLKRRKELGALLQHQGTITSLSFHNKTHMLSGSDDGKVCVWRSKDWECLKIMKGHQSSVHSIAIHPSGKIALSVSADHSVRLWNLLLGKQASMTRLQGEGLKVAWNPSGTGYSIMFDQELGIYDMATAKCIRTIKPARKTRMNTMAYYKDDYIIIGYEDKMVRVYSTATGDLVKTLVGHTNRIKAIDLISVPFTPEETSNKGFVGRPETKVVDILASVSSDGTILVWNLEDVVAPAASPEEINMKNHIGEHKTDMRVTCLSIQKGIWKNINVGNVGEAEGENDEDEDEEGEQEGEKAAEEEDEEEDEVDEDSAFDSEDDE
ncbi:p21-activated protein kinase-interacting protein 1-like protein [Entomortierella chlamydospora]|uniref:P21-activated protein kinase-interacting protein 1-like protein n=1 Tax=Entomortierella chlamydospora TaxID=101097 RepID=A0A9P6MRU7_9FUNG|nr:p21-activated protein kinase-interacting protein 1-like protein [Entomortierella chlamydospora]KAG0011191.1 p21-activated protein kinase-interacting protein 1-like protein [Entomortierella chlamydospora]